MACDGRVGAASVARRFGGSPALVGAEVVDAVGLNATLVGSADQVAAMTAASVGEPDELAAATAASVPAEQAPVVDATAAAAASADPQQALVIDASQAAAAAASAVPMSDPAAVAAADPAAAVAAPVLTAPTGVTEGGIAASG